MGRDREEYESNWKDINRMRKRLNMRLIETGIVSCLRCGQNFRSRDKIKNRICDSCKNSKERKWIEELYK